MPGSPATSPRFGAPRYANSDAVDFAGQVNGVTDALDLVAARFQSGLFSARPVTPADRTFYYATDRSGQADQLSAYVGGSWQNIPLGQVGTAEIQDGAVTAAKIETQAGWQTLTVGGGYAGGPIRYRKDSLGYVRFQHEAAYYVPAFSSVPDASVIATLPVGYRPPELIYPMIGSGSGVGATPPILLGGSVTIRINAAGQILGYSQDRTSSNSNYWYNLGPATFLAA